jgi:hypothetical protein
LSQAVDLLGHAFSVFLQGSERVEVLDVGGGVGQRYALVLRGYIAEIRRNFSQLGGCTQTPIDVGATSNLAMLPASRRLDDAADYKLPIAPDSSRIEPGNGPGPRRNLEQGLDLGLIGPCPQYLGAYSAPENERQRVNEDRLARAGFACNHAESRAKLENELLDEDDVLNT